LELLIDGRVLDDEAELFEGQWVELSASPPQGARLELLIGDAPLEPFLRPGDQAWRWRWQAPGAAGAYRLALRALFPDGGVDELRRALRVAPRKLDQERYAALLDDLQRLGRALVFALTGGAEGAAAPREADTSAPTAAEELHGLFGAELDRLAVAVERLARRPPDRLRQRIAPTDPAQARDLSAVDWSRLVGGGQDAAQQASGLTLLPIRQPLQAYDTYEARLLRRLLESLWRRLERLPGRAQLPAELAARADAARTRLRELRGLPFLAEVPPLSDYRGPTPRMQRDPEYRTVFRMWQLLRRRPLIAWEAATIDIPVGDLPRLYERWCAASAAIVLISLPGHRVLSQAILRDEGDEQLLALPEGKPLVRLESPGGAELALRYHPRYAGGAPLNQPSASLNAAGERVTPRALVSLDRHTRVPDLAIEIRRPDAPPAVIVLDAKYRLDAVGGVPEDALADAYSYLGSIGTAAGERAAAAAALLYPGRGRPEIYASGTAALPLLPGDDEALRQWLAAILIERQA
jgi:hypothetical protein